MTRVFHDGDFGIDDAMALLYLAAQPDVEVVGVGTVHGNTPALQAAANALQILDAAGLGSVEVTVGAARPLVQPLDISAMVHGDDGLGGAARPTSRLPGAGRAAAEHLVAVARAHGPDLTVLATGPLTNVALAVMLDGEAMAGVGSVVVMGGCVSAPGNITPFAEANIAHDPEAAEIVLGAGLPVRLVGLDVTMGVWLDDGHLARIASSERPGGRLLHAALGQYLGFYRARHGRPGCPQHDPTAAALALEPGLATWAGAPVRVELASPGLRGMLLVDRREFAAGEGDQRAPVVWATDVEAGALLVRLVAGYLGAARRGVAG